MPEGSLPLLIALIALVILSAFFSATETAFSCANNIKLRSMQNLGNKKAGKVLGFCEEKFDKLISTILVGNNIVNITAATLSTLLFAMIITSPADSSLISTVVTTLVILIFGEITPKFIVKSNPEKSAIFFYPFILVCYYIFYPFNFIFSGWKWLIAKTFKLKVDDKITEEEIMTVVNEAEEDGTLRMDETKLIRSVIEFDDLEVGDILVPRVNVAAVDVTDSMQKIRNVFEKEGYSRIPVYKDSIDTIIGTVHEKDFFLAYLLNKTDVKDIMQSAFYTTEHVKISILLKQLQKNKLHMAVVLDEYGGTLGIVTMEDILEELVGEIYDEHDEIISYVKRLDESTVLADGKMPIDEFFVSIGMEDEHDKFEAQTLSGWIIEYLGEIPKTGYSFSYNNVSIEILKATVKRVIQIKASVNQIAND